MPCMQGHPHCHSSTATVQSYSQLRTILVHAMACYLPCEPCEPQRSSRRGPAPAGPRRRAPARPAPPHRPPPCSRAAAVPRWSGAAPDQIAATRAARLGAARRIRFMHPSHVSESHFRVEARPCCRAPSSPLQPRPRPARLSPPPDRLNAQLQFDDSGCVNCTLELPQRNNLTDSTRTPTQSIRASRAEPRVRV